MAVCICDVHAVLCAGTPCAMAGCWTEGAPARSLGGVETARSFPDLLHISPLLLKGHDGIYGRGDTSYPSASLTPTTGEKRGNVRPHSPFTNGTTFKSPQPPKVDIDTQNPHCSCKSYVKKNIAQHFSASGRSWEDAPKRNTDLSSIPALNGL